MTPYRFFWFSVLSFLILSFSSCSEKLNAEQILEKSIASHGGIASWESVSSIRYLKETTLYTASGEIESVGRQYIEHHWDPDYTLMEWENENNKHRAFLDADLFTYSINGSAVYDSLLLESAISNAKASLYVFWQPITLLDPKAKLEKVALSPPLLNSPSLVVKVTYPQVKNGDIWHYFFDQKTFRLVATQVLHNGNTSFIVNETTETETGLHLNATRKSFTLDETGKIKFLRASYRYSILAIEYH